MRRMATRRTSTGSRSAPTSKATTRCTLCTLTSAPHSRSGTARSRRSRRGTSWRSLAIMGRVITTPAVCWRSDATLQNGTRRTAGALCVSYTPHTIPLPPLYPTIRLISPVHYALPCHGHREALHASRAVTAPTWRCFVSRRRFPNG